MLKLQGREAEEWREGKEPRMYVEGSLEVVEGLRERKRPFWQGLWKAVLQNYNPAGEPPTICWQHHKN